MSEETKEAPQPPISKRLFEDRGVYQGKILEQSWVIKDENAPKFVIKCSLEAKARNKYRLDRGVDPITEAQKAEQPEVWLSFGSDRINASAQALQSLGFTGTNPLLEIDGGWGDPNKLSFVGKEIWLQASYSKTDSSRLFWNLYQPRENNAEEIERIGRALNDVFVQTKEQLTTSSPF